MRLCVLQVFRFLVQFGNSKAENAKKKMLPSTQMKKGGSWKPQLMKDIMVMSKSRSRTQLKRQKWIIALACVVSIFLITAYFYPSQSSSTCYLFSSPNCSGMFGKSPPTPTRELTDDETASEVVVKEILKTPPLQSKNPKIVFMFLTPGTLPFEELWENFFQVALLTLCVLSNRQVL